MQATTHAPLGKQRLEALTEGIYAIAMTLLVLELKLPPLEHGASNAQLVEALRALAPKVLTWILSFWVMVVFWLGQVRVYHLLAGVDATLMRVELLMLACVSLLPFSTALMGEHSDLPAAAVVYSANLLVAGLLSSVRTWHLLRHPGLHGPGLDAATARHLRVRAWTITASTLATLVLAFFWPRWNMLAMLPTLAVPRLARAWPPTTGYS
jgi:uncharacterized membrane protein